MIDTADGVKELERKRKSLQKKIRLLEKELHDVKSNFQSLYNGDQIAYPEQINARI